VLPCITKLCAGGIVKQLNYNKLEKKQEKKRHKKRVQMTANL
jgi:hypothetical protein